MPMSSKCYAKTWCCHALCGQILHMNFENNFAPRLVIVMPLCVVVMRFIKIVTPMSHNCYAKIMVLLLIRLVLCYLVFLLSIFEKILHILYLLNATPMSGNCYAKTWYFYALRGQILHRKFEINVTPKSCYCYAILCHCYA